MHLLSLPTEFSEVNAYNLHTMETLVSVFIANLLEIKDHYPKYVVTLDELAAGNVNGVKIVHLADFLLSYEY